MAEDETGAVDKILEREAAAMFSAVAVLESRLGIESGFLFKPKRDSSDWSFLVRLAVFIQAALAHAVAHELGRAELEDYCARMNLNARHGGLVALAQQLGVIGTGDVAYIDGVSELRNRYAHRLENINRPLPAFIASLSPQDFRKIVGSVLITAGEKNRLETADSIVRTLVAQQVRAGIWLNAIGLCSKLSESAADAEVRNARRQLRETQEAARISLFHALGRDAEEKPAQ